MYKRSVSVDPASSSVPSMENVQSGVLFWCFVLLLLVVPQTTLAVSPYLGSAYASCKFNTTNGSLLIPTFKRNLNTVLKNLTHLSSQGTKYAKTTAGSGDSMVYAMFQCRGDQSTLLCEECVANATARLPQRDCPTSIGARIQLDGCYLRYSNQSFFTLDVTPAIGYCYAKTNGQLIPDAIAYVLEYVVSTAPKQGGFASASLSHEFAAAQCLGYLNESECSACLSAVPYSIMCDSSLGEQVHLTSCYYRFEPYNFLSTLPSSALAPAPAKPVQASVPPRTQNKSHTGLKIAAIVASIGIAAILVCLILVWRRKASKKTGKKAVRRQASWAQPIMQTKARVFSLQELEDATRNFHPDNKLGEGGYGSVYKGTLSNGEQVAIKKLAHCSRQGVREFLSEVNLITSVQHKNLIRLLGSCSDGYEKILVYEYLPNKSLDLQLFGQEEDGQTLDWQARYGIILGTAKGLAYLHEESHIRIIHRDIKPSNILLDSQLSPTIADFGLARLLQENETDVNTRLVGSIGYLAPEYAMRGELSEKADVFSFGVVLLEILSGKKNLHGRILEWAWRLFTQNKILDLMDTKLGQSHSADQVIRTAQIALLCTQENANQRPTMSEVVFLLTRKFEIPDIPRKPSFITLSEPRELGGAMNDQLNTNISCFSSNHSLVMSNANYSTSANIDPR